MRHRPPPLWQDLCCIIFFLTSTAGILTHCVLLDSFSAAWIAPQFLGIWLSSLLNFYSLQAFWLIHVAPPRGLKTSFMLFGHYCLVGVISFVLMIGYFVGFRVDGGIWALSLILCAILNSTLAWGRVVRAQRREELLGYEQVNPHDEGSVNQEEGEREEARGRQEGRQEGRQGEREVVSGRKKDAKKQARGDHSVNAAGFDADEANLEERKTKKLLLLAAGFNAFLISLALVFLGLLLGGCWVQAIGYHSYPPPGVFVTLVQAKEQLQKVMVYCTGEFNASRPTIVIDVGGGGHSSSDMYGMQFALNDEGYRVCSYDYPGCGWSDNGVDASQPQILDDILTAINEPPPYILIGTMDGAPTRIYEYALRYPRKVEALIPIDYSPGPSEMETLKILRGYSDEEATSYAVETINGRHRFGNIIQGIAVQWGLMAIFAPARGNFVPAEREEEKLFLNLYNEKQWHTQVVYLARQLVHPELLFTYDNWSSKRTLDANIPVLWIYNNVNITRQCEEYRYSEVQCEEAKRAKEISRSYIEEATNMTVGSKIIQYEDAREMLSQGEYLGWTVEQILANI